MALGTHIAIDSLVAKHSAQRHVATIWGPLILINCFSRLTYHLKGKNHASTCSFYLVCVKLMASDAFIHLFAAEKRYLENF